MATFTKSILSGSTDGRAIKVAAAGTPGTLIHTGSTTPATLHEVWLYAMNSAGTTPIKTTIEWGGVTNPDDHIEFSVMPESGLTLLVPGLIIKGNATPLLVRAFAASANAVTIHGFVNVIA